MQHAAAEASVAAAVAVAADYSCLQPQRCPHQMEFESALLQQLPLRMLAISETAPRLRVWIPLPVGHDNMDTMALAGAVG